MKYKGLQFQKGDWFAIGLVAFLALAVFVLCLPSSPSGAGEAQVYLEGDLIHTLPLSEAQSLTVTGDYTNVITVSDGRVAITESDCPGGDCVHSGWISTSGRSLVCLPNGLEIRVITRTGDVDFVVG